MSVLLSKISLINLFYIYLQHRSKEKKDHILFLNQKVWNKNKKAYENNISCIKIQSQNKIFDQKQNFFQTPTTHLIFYQYSIFSSIFTFRFAHINTFHSLPKNNNQLTNNSSLFQFLKESRAATQLIW